MDLHWFTVGFALLFSAQNIAAEETSAASTFHMQITSVSQQHAGFASSDPPYPGPNSLSDSFDSKTSLTWTFFLGHRLWHGAEFYIDPEMAGGAGFNKTTGIAGFPNAEIYRVDDASPKWNLARVFVKQVFALGDELEAAPDQQNQIAAQIPVRRLTLVVGKFALNDCFDNNSLSHDPRNQFLNWALMDQGAWDYAADTRGYSLGFYLEWNEPRWAVRFASVQEPAQANEMQMDQDLRDAHGDNLEFEWRYKIYQQPGVLRFLAYQNHARMGNYRQAIDSAGGSPPDVIATRSKGRLKTGFALNGEQVLAAHMGVFARAGWNDGQNETWAFTEIDRSVSAGLSVNGALWSRPDDTAAVAVIANWPIIASICKREASASSLATVA
jgi:high affinity Mn2+ porin